MSTNVTVDQVGYLPECSGLEEADFSPKRALSFDPRSYTRYYVDLWGSVVPALVFGSLAAVGFIFFLVWLCVQHRRAKRGERLQQGLAAQQQFISDGGAGKPAPAKDSSRAEVQQKRLVTWGRFLKLCVVLLALALAGVCGWGIDKSVDATNSMVDNFWDLVDTSEEKIQNISTTLQTLDYQIGNVSYAMGVTADVMSDIPGVVMLIPGVRDVVKTLQTKPLEAQKLLDGLQEDVQSAITGIDEKAQGTIDRLRNNYYWWTSDLQDKWRFVVIAVVLGLTIICGLLAGALVLFMSWPKSASFCVALLWFMVMILMFLGTGLFKGVFMISEDACLYMEPFTMRLVNETVTPEATRDQVLSALNYYFGFYDIPGELVVYELFGAPTHQILDIMQSSLVGSVLDILNSGSGVLSTISNAVGISDEEWATIYGLVALAPEVADTIADLDRQANRENIQPLYFDAKEWICCDVKNNVYDVWLAWTVAGALGWALAAACSVRVVLHTLEIRGQGGTTAPAAVELAPSGSPAPDGEKGKHPIGLVPTDTAGEETAAVEPSAVSAAVQRYLKQGQSAESPVGQP